MDPGAIRYLQSPSGIAKTNKQGRRPGKIACTACHARKKRCDIAPPYNQCTHCRKENQCCIPRDSMDRPIRRPMPNRSDNSQKAASNYENQFQVNGFLPKGIDHEIPRWSAVYSSYSEMRRLLPSLTSASISPSPSAEIEGETTYMQTAANETKLDVSSLGVPSRCPQSGVLCRDGAEVTSIEGISTPAPQCWSRSSAPINERAGLEKALACEAENLYGCLASAGEVRVPSGGDFGPAHDAFINDLDALLRF